MKHNVCVIVFTVVCIFVILACDKATNENSRSRERYPPDTRDQVTISQGAWGNVWFWEGDFMPFGWGNITPVVRKIYAYQLTNLQQVDQVPYSPFYRRIFSQVVDSALSNSTGFFQISLAPGRYSFFVKEDSLFYANGYDGTGNILPATVKKDSLTQVQLDITYKATY